MSATTAETLGSDATLRVFSEKNPQRKNGYLSEKNSKEYLLEIVKEAIKEDILEEEEDEKDSTNLVVGKVVEVKDDLNVNVLNENRNVLVNGYKENSDSLQSSEKFDVPEVNKTTTNENTKSTHLPDTDNLINSSGDNLSMDSLEKDSLSLKNFESESSERDVICLDKKDLVDFSDKLNGATTSNKNMREDCLKFIQQEVKHCKENNVSSHIPSVSESSSIQSTCNSNQGDVHCDNQSQEINNTDVGNNLASICEEEVLSKVQSSGDIDGGGSSSSVTDIAKTKPAVEDNSYRNLAAEGQLISNGIVERIITETKFSEVNSLEVAANLVEKVDSSDSLEDETYNCFTFEESLSNPNTLLGENKNLPNVGICKVESKNKKLETDLQSDQNQFSDENVSHPSAQNKESVEVSSSRIEENVDKLDFGSKGFLKRPPRNKDENEESSKKCKFFGDELTTISENNSKRRSSGGMSDFTSSSKKIRLSEDSNGSAEPGHIIVNGSNQEVAVDINKKNNENVMVKKLVEKIPDKKEKVKEGKKLNKDKLRTKELKKIKEKDQKLDHNSHHLNGTIDKNSVNPTYTADVVESETSTKVNKLKLKKMKDLEDDEEYKLLNGPGINTCPLCNCTCKFKKNDRKILGEKTKAFMDVVSGNSENININLVQKLEELVGQTVADWATNKCEVGAVRRRVHYLEEEHDRLTQLTIHLKKQLDDARCIIKRIIDEKIAHKSWAEGIVPLKVTRSVGMQVCTAGSSHVLMKPLEHDKEPHQTTIASPIPTTKTNPVNSNNNKCSKGTSGNSSRTDDILMGAAPNVSSPHISTAVTVPVAVKSRTEGVDKPKHILHSTLSNPKPVPQSATIPSCVLEDDLEVQVIEPATDEINKEKIIPGVSLPTVSVNPALTSITNHSSTTGHLTSGIYLLNTPPVSGAVIRNTRQVSPNVPVTSASEIIDLTDNDHMAGQNKTAVAMHVASRLAGPTNSRTSASQPNTKQNTLSLNAVTSANTSTGSNKVVTFPADSTTTYMIQRPNNPNSTVVRKAVSQPSSSEETEVLLTSLSTLPPLPRAPKYGPNILKPPRPTLRICKNSTGIMLSWNFEDDLPTTIRKYQVYAYQEGAPVEGTKTEMWKKVGDVDALPLPMACTLTQFKEGHKYFFVVRAIDVNTRLGDFSLPGSIMLTSSSSQSNATPRM